jgi:isoquinoline 1-oxidoreductase subunit beta
MSLDTILFSPPHKAASQRLETPPTSDSTAGAPVTTRRWFLKASMAVGGIGLVAGIVPAEAASNPYLPTPPTDAYALQPVAWLEFKPDNRLLIRYAKAEMGQGISTALPQILAEELDADWNLVETGPAPLADAFNDPRMKERDTGGSRSVRFSYEVLRTIGAAGREMLAAAAAKRWNVPATEVTTGDSMVRHAASGRGLTYAALAADLASIPVPEKPNLKSPDSFKIIGRSVPRLDVAAKTNGKAIYTADIRLPDMLTATVAQSPIFGGKVRRVDDRAAKAIKGVVAVHVFDTWIAVVANDFWTAKRGLDALTIEWDAAGNGGVSSAGIRAAFVEAAKSGKPAVAKNEGDAAAQIRSSARTVKAVYEVPYLAHAPMEPMGAVAQVKDGGCELWVGTQRPTVTRDFCAQLLGIGKEKVVINDLMIGGAFGRRFEFDFVEHAVEVARRANGRPVKVLWTREEEMQHGFYRPSTYNELEAAIDADGKVSAWQHRIVSQALIARVRPYAFRNGIDPTAVEGASNLPYAIPNLLVDYVRSDNPVPVGAWRSVGSSQNAFITECFFDEVAAAMGRDPLELRRELLAGKRHLAVLEAVAKAAGWGSPMPKGFGRGIAVAECFGGWSAQVAEVEALGNGKIRLHRIVAGIDCGRVVNPDIVKAQLEGAVLYGLSAALSGAVTIAGGRVEQ